MPNYRLLKVICQPVFVKDEDGVLEEATGQAVTVPAREWPEYPERLAADLAAVNAAGGGE